MVLKSDELFLVGRAIADGSGEPASGLYLRDTRYLNRFEVRLNGEPLRLLSVRELGPATALAVSANSLVSINDGGTGESSREREQSIQPLTVAVEQHIQLTTDLQVRFVIQNFGGRTLPLTLSIEVGADLDDLFAIRGFPRLSRTGTFLPIAIETQSVTFAYVDAAGGRAMTVVRFDQPLTPTTPGMIGRTRVAQPDRPRQDDDVIAQGAAPSTFPTVTVAFQTVLESGQSWELTVTVSPLPPEPATPTRIQRPSERTALEAAEISTDNPNFNRVLSRAATDLAMLQTSFPEGSLPAAGVPWFVAPFGRDSLIVGLQTLHLAPGRAAETLRVLAALQGSVEDPFREEEPGKILHEMRYGEMARLGEIPHTPYYGSLDSTPLFILLFAETVAWSGDDQLFDDLLPNVERALAWIERYGDLDGDGLVEYRARSVDGTLLVHQVWKDSHDSLHYRDGRPAVGLIAPVEVQGYVYAAYRSLAAVVASRGWAQWAAALQARAEVLRQRVEEKFWLPEDDAGYYAQALDGDKSPVGAISSNPGHLLYCGLPSQHRAEAVAARMVRPDLDSGWGIRTLSTAMPTYNPMSYHNGSVWPHDNSLIAAGLGRYGLVEDANRIATALFAVATADPMDRLPELICGFARTNVTAAPVAYPVSCSPQAWAAAASQLLMRAMLGLTLDENLGVLFVEPAMPEWLSEISISGISVRGLPASLRVVREADGYAIETEGPIRPGTSQPIGEKPVRVREHLVVPPRHSSSVGRRGRQPPQR